MANTKPQMKGETMAQQKMLKVTYQVFEKELNRSFENTKTVEKLDDFRLFAYSLFHGSWKILNVIEI